MTSKLLIAVGAGRAADSVVADGLRLAGALGASVVLLHVVTAFDLPLLEAPARAYLTPEQLDAGLATSAASTLARHAALAVSLGVLAHSRIASGVAIAHGIVENAVDQACDLIVVGRGRRVGWRALLRANVAAEVVSVAPVPVWVSRPLA